MAYDLARQINLKGSSSWKVELVLNSKKFGSAHGMAGMHSFIVLSYNGKREWVLDPWQSNLPEIYYYESFSKIWPLDDAYVNTITDTTGISLDYD